MAQEFMKMYRWVHLLARASSTKMRMGQLCWPIGPVLYHGYCHYQWVLLLSIPPRDDGDNAICSVQTFNFSTQLIPRGSPGSQEVWKRDGFFYHYLICPYVLYQGGLSKPCWGFGVLVPWSKTSWATGYRASLAQGLWEPLFWGLCGW